MGETTQAVPSLMTSGRGSRLALALLLLVLAWGAWLRLAHLGNGVFGTDEMNHYYVGKALAEGNGPVLPSGTRYTRGLDYSRMVAWVLPGAESPEAAVRLPAAVLGVLGLVVMALLGWRIGGPWVALLATLLLAIYPEALRLSRYGRFYTLQLLAILVAGYAGWRLLESPLVPERRRNRAWLGQAGWALLMLVALAYATSVQVVSLSVMVGFGAAVACLGTLDLVRAGRAAWRWSVSWQLTVLGCLAVLLLLGLWTSEIQALWHQARSVPMWARLSRADGGAVTAYYRALSTVFPLVVSLSPLAFLVCLLHRPRAGIFLLAWFGVPLLLHSLLFSWKAERYILGAVPGLLLATALAGAIGLAGLSRHVSGALERTAALRRGPARTLAAVLAGLVAVAAVVTQPAFNAARRNVRLGLDSGWLESRNLIEADSALARLPLGSATPLPALHYWGRLDFVVQPALLESWARDTSGAGPYAMKPMGSPDVYAGRPTLTTPEAIAQAFGGSPVLLGIDQKYFTFHNIDSGLARVLQTQATELCRGQCGTMRLFLWRPAGEGAMRRGPGGTSLPS